MKSVLTSAAVAALILLSPSTAAAWNDVGHMSVAKLAWDRLDHQRRDAAYRTLRQLPHLERFLGDYPQPANVGEKEWLFLIASTWPDWLRGFKKAADQNEPAGKSIYENFHIGPRHYIDIPYIFPSAEQFKGKKPNPDPKVNIVMALEKDLPADFKEGDGPRKAVAFCWLLHLVGDIHQPLHCTTRYSDEYPTGDAGGNDCWVRKEGFPTSLHAYWDDALGGFPRPNNPRDFPPYFKKVYAKTGDVVSRLSRPPYDLKAFADQIKKSRPRDWAAESHELGVKVAYQNGELNGIRIAYKTPFGIAQELRHEAPEVSSEYIAESVALAKQRVALASHRLTDQLTVLLP